MMERTEVRILLDNGHGENTPGKRSPDGSVREYLYARNVVAEVARILKAEGYNVDIITPEKTDVPLSTRCNRANWICRNYGSDKCLLVSVHLNAMGNGSSWMPARGWQVYVSNNASSRSKTLAGCIFDEAQKRFRTRKPDSLHKYWRQNLAICRDTLCPAVLTENLYMDNYEDVKLLMSGEGFQSIVHLHCEGIKKYIRIL